MFKGQTRLTISKFQKCMAMLNLKERDKQQHLFAGIIVTAPLYPIFGHFAVAIAIGVGLVKEYVVDEIWSLGEPDIWDAVATRYGCFVSRWACLACRAGANINLFRGGADPRNLLNY